MIFCYKLRTFAEFWYFYLAKYGGRLIHGYSKTFAIFLAKKQGVDLYTGSTFSPENTGSGGPEAIIYKILERGGPESLKVEMAFEYSFQSFSYKSFANISPKGGGGLGPSPKSATVVLCWFFCRHGNNELIDIALTEYFWRDRTNVNNCFASRYFLTLKTEL